MAASPAETGPKTTRTPLLPACSAENLLPRPSQAANYAKYAASPSLIGPMTSVCSAAAGSSGRATGPSPGP